MEDQDKAAAAPLDIEAGPDDRNIIEVFIEDHPLFALGAALIAGAFLARRLLDR